MQLLVVKQRGQGRSGEVEGGGGRGDGGGDVLRRDVRGSGGRTGMPGREGGRGRGNAGTKHT